MKKIIFLSVLLNVMLLSAQTSEGFELSKIRHDFGDINTDEVVVTNVILKNTDERPLVVEDVTVQCGCTAVNPPKSPIFPGEEYNLEVKFDSHNKEGFQRKAVTIITNKGIQVFTFTANILPH